MMLRNKNYYAAAASITAITALLILSPYSPRLNGITALLFSGLCHQLPERCVWIAGAPMAVCARCFGIYLGAFFGVLAAPWISRREGGLRLIHLFAPILVDAGINIFITTPTEARAVTGLLAGFGAAVIALPAFIEPLSWPRPARQGE